MQCYCAFCRSQRKIYTKKRINFFDVLSCGLGAIVTMYILWQQMDPRAILVFVSYLAVAEVFIHFRWRLTIVCAHCGFDPVLYMKDSDKAAQKVKIHLEKRKQDPASLLRAPLQIPVRRKPAESTLSRHV